MCWFWGDFEAFSWFFGVFTKSWGWAFCYATAALWLKSVFLACFWRKTPIFTWTFNLYHRKLKVEKITKLLRFEVKIAEAFLWFRHIIFSQKTWKSRSLELQYNKRKSAARGTIFPGVATLLKVFVLNYFTCFLAF